MPSARVYNVGDIFLLVIAVFYYYSSANILLLTKYVLVRPYLARLLVAVDINDA